VWCVRWFCGRIIPAWWKKNLPLFASWKNYRKFPARKKPTAHNFFVHPRRRKNRIGVLFSSFAVKDENLYGIDEIACRTSIRMMHGE
jgi:hypothetical protein